MGINGCAIGFMIRSGTPQRTQESLNLLARTEESKGTWRALGTLASDRLSALRHVTDIDSIGSWTRIEGRKLSDREVERLLSSLQIKSFAARDEQEVLFVGRNRPQPAGRDCYRISIARASCASGEWLLFAEQIDVISS